MMRNVSPLLALAIFAACGDARTDDPVDHVDMPVDALAKYRPLIGDWMDSTSSDTYTCFERWATEGDSALVGFGHVIAEGDTVFIEDLRLGVDNGQVVYSARAGSQNNGAWVPFTAQETGPDTLMFENAAHDFPQCITYIKDASGTWHVSVTGTEEGVDREELFVFRPH